MAYDLDICGDKIRPEDDIVLRRVCHVIFIPFTVCDFHPVIFDRLLSTALVAEKQA